MRSGLSHLIAELKAIAEKDDPGGPPWPAPAPAEKALKKASARKSSKPKAPKAPKEKKPTGDEPVYDYSLAADEPEADKPAPKEPDYLHHKHPAVRASNVAQQATKDVKPGSAEDHGKAAMAHRVAAQVAKHSGHHELASSHAAMADLHHKASKSSPPSKKMPVSNTPEIDIPKSEPHIAHSGGGNASDKGLFHTRQDDPYVQNTVQHLQHVFANDPKMHKPKSKTIPNMPAKAPKRVKAPKMPAKTEDVDVGSAPAAPSAPIETTTATPPEVAQASNSAEQATTTCSNTPNCPPENHAYASLLHGIAFGISTAYGDHERAKHHKKMKNHHKKLAKKSSSK